jgi:hemolysin activation/secretion protein
VILRWSRCRAILVGTVAGWCVVCPARAQTIPPPPDPGRISNENLRNQRQIQRETEPQLEGPNVVGPAAPPAVIGPSGGPTFVLKKVVFDHSEFISAAVLDALAAPFIGRKVDNADLQRLLKSINDRYAERHQITAIAYLPKQNLKKGVLHIGIVEGRVGNVNIRGTRQVKPETVTGAVRLVPGEVVDVPKLERDVAWFNKGRLAQIQSSLQPGVSFGLTNIDFSVIEPPANLLQVFLDNQGVYSVGEFEGGLNFQHYGLLGIDDKFTLYGIAAHGNRNINLAYDIPFNPWSGRAGVSFSDGTIAVYKGAYRDLDITGQSHNLAFNLSQPLVVTPAFAFLLNGAFSDSVSASDQSHVSITDNDTRKQTAGFTVSYTSEKFSATLSPNYSFAHTNFRVVDTTQDFQEVNATYSAALKLPFDFVATSIDVGQWANQKLLAGDQLFQIGGPTTVRGYPTSGVAGYAGYYGNMELHHNVDALVSGLDAFGFVDYGAVYSTFPQSVYLTSVGLGLSYDTKKNLVADISAGTPLTHAIPDHPDYFVYFRVTAKFSNAGFN